MKEIVEYTVQLPLISVTTQAKLVNIANGFVSDITLTTDKSTVDFKSILGVMSLALGVGSVATFRAVGEDAESAIESIAKNIK